MKESALSYSRYLNKEYIFKIGRKQRMIVLSIDMDSTNFFHLTGIHHIHHLKVRPQVFYNRCLSGDYNKENLLNYFSSENTSYFSNREYHSLRIEVVENLGELLSEPTELIFKKIKKKTFYPGGANFDFSYCIEKELVSSEGIEYKAIIYLKFSELENNVEKLKIQSIGIQRPDYQLYQLSIWKVINHEVIEGNNSIQIV